MQISFAGYGDKEGIYPNVNERVLHVLTNMARMAPQSFDDDYLLNGILDSYTAVHPLYLDQTLSKLARYHSEDMAHNGYGFHKEAGGHYSSKLQNPPDTIFNGDVVQFIDSLISFGERVKGVNDSNFNYTESSSTSENVAWVYSSSGNVPIRFFNNWLNSTGHRNNIFNASRYEMGNGFVPNDTIKYWSGDTWIIKTFNSDKAGLATQVLGKGTEINVGPIFSGVGADSIHTLLTNIGGNETWSKEENSTTSYLANYYDPGKNPISADLILEGTRIALDLHMGSADAGTYTYSETTGGCKNFYFEFKDANNKTWTYPETTYLGTSSECDFGAERGLTSNYVEPILNTNVDFKKGMHVSLYAIGGKRIFDGVLQSNELPEFEMLEHKNSILFFVVNDKNLNYSGKLILK